MSTSFPLLPSVKKSYFAPASLKPQRRKGFKKGKWHHQQALVFASPWRRHLAFLPIKAGRRLAGETPPPRTKNHITRARWRSNRSGACGSGMSKNNNRWGNRGKYFFPVDGMKIRAFLFGWQAGISRIRSTFTLTKNKNTNIQGLHSRGYQAPKTIRSRIPKKT